MPLRHIRKALVAFAGAEGAAGAATVSAIDAGSLPDDPLNLAIYVGIVHRNDCVVPAELE